MPIQGSCSADGEDAIVIQNPCQIFANGAAGFSGSAQTSQQDAEKDRQENEQSVFHK